MALGGVSTAALVAAIVGGFQVQDRADERYLLRQQYVAEASTKQVQIINVQIVQTETQLEIIEQRQKENRPRDGDATRHAKLLQALIRLEAARDELLKK